MALSAASLYCTVHVFWVTIIRFATFLVGLDLSVGVEIKHVANQFPSWCGRLTYLFITLLLVTVLSYLGLPHGLNPATVGKYEREWKEPSILFVPEGAFYATSTWCNVDLTWLRCLKKPLILPLPSTILILCGYATSYFLANMKVSHCLYLKG